MRRGIVAAGLAASVTASCFINVADAYPGMQSKASTEMRSSVDRINVLPKPYPVDMVAFKDGQGRSIDVSKFRGQIVMVNMWATWCPPCVRELPAMARFKAKLDPKSFKLLPISIDAKGKQTVEPFLASLKLENFDTYYDPQQALSQVFPLDTIPATFILNRQGELIAFVRTFVDWDDDKAVELLNSFIKQQTKH